MKEPPADVYIKLGNIAGDPECWYFWSRAGLNANDVISVLPSAKPNINKLVITGSQHLGVMGRNSRFGVIPLLRLRAGAHGHVGDGVGKMQEIGASDAVVAPRGWCPNPSKTSCLRVRGESMAPLIHDDYILAVDTSEADAARLRGKVVVAWHQSKGLTVSRLRRLDNADLLVSENPNYETVSMHDNRGWRIVGKVLWWIGKAS